MPIYSLYRPEDISTRDIGKLVFFWDLRCESPCGLLRLISYSVVEAEV